MRNPRTATKSRPCSPQLEKSSRTATKTQRSQKVVRKRNKVKNSNTHNMTEFQICYAHWKKPDTKGHKLYDSISMILFQRQNHRTEKSWARAGAGVGGDYKGAQEVWGRHETVLYLDFCGGMTVYVYQNSQNCKLRRVNFIAYKLYLN